MALILWAQIESTFYQSVQARHFAAVIREPKTVEPVLLRQEPTSQPFRSPTQSLLKPLTMLGQLDSMIIGRLDIPRLGLTAMIREGVEPLTLRKAIGHVPGTALPGKLGNFVVAAHRDSFFRSLRLVQNGDDIHIRTRDGAFTYRVTGLSVVDPNDTQAVQPTATPVCTLVTCLPFEYVGPAPRRFIVRGEMTP